MTDSLILCLESDKYDFGFCWIAFALRVQMKCSGCVLVSWGRHVVVVRVIMVER